MKDKVGKQHFYRFLGSNQGIEILLNNREHQKIGALKWKTEGSMYTLYWRFSNIPFELYTYVLAKILQNGATFIQKLTPGFKNYVRNLENFRQAVKSPKS